jgi:hypothetical protein
MITSLPPEFMNRMRRRSRERAEARRRGAVVLQTLVFIVGVSAFSWYFGATF